MSNLEDPIIDEMEEDLYWRSNAQQEQKDITGYAKFTYQTSCPYANL